MNEKRPEQKRKKAIELFSDYKVTQGFFVPVHGTNKNTGAIGFAGERNELDHQARAEIHFLTYFAYEKLIALTGEQRAPTTAITERELDCLKWTANGKTSSEIGIILSISAHTVNNHLASCVEKLGAMNRTQAVATAMRHGMLA